MMLCLRGFEFKIIPLASLSPCIGSVSPDEIQDIAFETSRQMRAGKHEVVVYFWQ